MANDFSVALAIARAKRKLGAFVKNSTLEITATLEEEAQSLAQFQRRLAPFDTGALRRSIRVAKGKNKKGEAVVTVSAGDAEVYYARWVEFGTQGSTKGSRVKTATRKTRKSYRTHPGTDAQPFFYAPYRARRQQIKRNIRNVIRKAAIKAAKS